jgi:hypothetical protein
MRVRLYEETFNQRRAVWRANVNINHCATSQNKRRKKTHYTHHVYMCTAKLRLTFSHHSLALLIIIWPQFPFQRLHRPKHLISSTMQHKRDFETFFLISRDKCYWHRGCNSWLESRRKVNIARRWDITGQSKVSCSSSTRNAHQCGAEKLVTISMNGALYIYLLCTQRI